MRDQQSNKTVDVYCAQCAKPMKASINQAKPMCRKCFKHYGQRVWNGNSRIHRR